MKIFVVACLLAWVHTAFSDPTPNGDSHLERGPKGQMTPTQSKEAAPLIVGDLMSQIPLGNTYEYYVKCDTERKTIA
ncbi:unnamed protein product [Allacma fusca]|uniref:Uncharacterized protein n=1 Tax=Allacma fusca TaxID=39272 RepID=A0A8J2LIN3_9HEXA|nr:unnamed protein product [Allacma fusca]